MTDLNPFGKMKYDSKTAVDADTLGGSKFTPLPSNVYDLTVKLLYLTQSEKGAWAVNLEATTPDNKTYKESVYISNAAGENEYKDSKTGEMKVMSSFLTMNALCLLTDGKAIKSQRMEKKVINVYSYKDKKDIPTEVLMLVDIVGKQFKAGILLREQNKRVKNQENVYVNTADIVSVNVLDKVFRFRDSCTETEIRAGATEGSFIKDWKAKYEGQVDNWVRKVQGSSGAPTGQFAAGSSATSGEGSAPPADNPFM